ncbi:hypothetical protein BCY84_22452 [Trypanosoma cruzi cruzi]|nr:hypothetical protein BCY84_22452 [Trypanosoma cruzi cruzi]
MMMTCRLLCALLVLALCCCPSVCVAALRSCRFFQTTTTTTTKAGVNNDEANIKAVGKDAGQSPSPPIITGDGQPGSSSLEPLRSWEMMAEVISSDQYGTNEVSNALKADGNKGTTGYPVTRDYPRNRQIGV